MLNLFHEVSLFLKLKSDKDSMRKEKKNKPISFISTVEKNPKPKKTRKPSPTAV